MCNFLLNSYHKSSQTLTKSCIFKLIIIEILVLQHLDAHFIFPDNTDISKVNVPNIFG